MALENYISQEQAQTQELQQRLTSHQVAYMRMLEMPLEMLRGRIEEELIENAALERDTEAQDTVDNDEFQNSAEGAYEGDDSPSYTDQDTLDEIEYFESERVGKQGSAYDDDRQNGWSDADTPDFHDTLMAQVSEYTLTDHQRELLEYLIGSLDDDGLLTKKLYVIADELEIYRQISTSEEELREMLDILQQFDPAGIGAQSLQETLQLQIRRRIDEHPDSALWPLLLRVISEQWDSLGANRWDKIRSRLHINEGEMRALQRMLRTLTPSPGCPSSEKVTTHAANAITPDFIVEISDDGSIEIRLNEPGIPTLRINSDFAEQARRSQVSMTRSERDAHNYVRSKVAHANAFIQNMRSRRETLLRVMREVAMAQHDYLVTGDETLVHQLIMKDVAVATGTDVSIVSRVAGSKWVETPYGIRPLRWFFRSAGGVTRDDGVALEQDSIKNALAAEVAAEDKRKPLADDALAKVLKSKGFPVARRTVAKYREMLGIPVARLRQIR